MLAANNIFANMFDILRMVDPEEGLLLEFDANDTIQVTKICCTDVFGSGERCRNCTSTRAYYSNTTKVKLEYANGMVLLIFSTPITYEGRRLVVEMVKDITDSMTLDVQDKQRMDGVTNIIFNLNKVATTDALTSLYNRRYLDENLPKVLENCKAIGQPLCVALFDIDDFKAVNDTYGHHAGDMVLSATAESISTYVRRGSDWGARYGGEELFTCFVGVPLQDGRKILERIRQHIEENLILIDDYSISVTVSVGLAELEMNETPAALLARCDHLLYQAKRKGKNRVEFEVDGPKFITRQG